MKKKNGSKEDVFNADNDALTVTEMQISDNETEDTQEGDNPIGMDTVDPIKEKIEEARVMAADLNRFVYNSQTKMAEMAINLGTVLIELKSLIKKSDLLWQVWAEENLPFIGKRNREKYMLLASRKDCQMYTNFGVDRLEKLCSSTKGVDGKDPIGGLLTKHRINLDERSENELDEFKSQVDVALNIEKLEKSNIPLPLDLVNNVTRQGIEFDKALLAKLGQITQAGGDPEDHLLSLSMRGGKEKKEATGEERWKDFNSLANRMIMSVDYILINREQISRIDWDSFHRLLQKLMELESATNIITEQAKAA